MVWHVGIAKVPPQRPDQHHNGFDATTFPKKTCSPFGLPSQTPGLVNERKFVGEGELAFEACRILDAVALPDGEYPDGLVRSVYFDSPRLESYSEKENGDNLKRKLRIRWYDTPGNLQAEEIPVFIESKGRVGSARRKERIQVMAPARLFREAPLSDPGFASFLARHAPALSEPVPAGWMPSAVVAYHRRRYFCPESGTRLAVDWDISIPRANPLLLPFTSPVFLPLSLVEFKNEGGTPPPWAELLFHAGFRLRSFSKYGEGIRRIFQGV